MNGTRKQFFNLIINVFYSFRTERLVGETLRCIDCNRLTVVINIEAIQFRSADFGCCGILVEVIRQPLFYISFNILRKKKVAQNARPRKNTIIFFILVAFLLNADYHGLSQIVLFYFSLRKSALIRV